MKKHITEWEKIFANCVSGKGHISIIREELSNSTQKQSNKEMGKRFEWTLHQRRHADGKLAYEKMLNIISE